jgi:hypothetical protein
MALPTRTWILRLHFSTQDYRLLYIVEGSDKKQIIVKFTRRYSIELYAFCAGRGHALGILGFGQLPGGWSVVAMDYISPSVHPSQSPYGLAHGDLREPNILAMDVN